MPAEVATFPVLGVQSITVSQAEFRQTEPRTDGRTGAESLLSIQDTHCGQAHDLLLNTDVHQHVHFITTPQAYAKNQTVATQSRPRPHDKKKHT